MPIEIGPFARGELGPGLSPYVNMVGNVFDDFTYDSRITHIRDGKHSEGSLHYIGDAIDVIWLPYRDLPDEMAYQIRDELYQMLNGFPKIAGLVPDYDIVYEKSHFHLEYQPKLSSREYHDQVELYIYGAGT